ncbi:hypothetical protein [Microbacterium sp. NPDC058389]|uniref:hypothetical protein n=1 Tax=Microbacterium sp. NPDC058389 TaxID=3346475 RepID=UPI003649D527
MTTWDEFFYPHTVSIRARVGGGSLGSRYAAAHDVSAEVLDEQQLVRDRDGQEVVSSTRVTVPLDTNAPVGSLVTVWPGAGAGVTREAEVLAVARDDNGDDPLDSHLVLRLK